MKKKSIFICQNCEYQTPKWLGKCPECNQWNSFTEESFSSQKEIKNIKKVATSEEKPLKVSEIELEKYERSNSGIFEFDRVLGGGIVRGSLTLIGGEPGIGKSTLLTDVLGKLASNNPSENVLYISGEESTNQVGARVRRLNIDASNLYIYNESTWERVLEQVKRLKPRFMLIDSIQTTVSEEIQSAPGTVSQIREVTYQIMNYIKHNDITCFVIGHITKDGNIAGPKILEHMVDTVIYFEGDQFGHYRMLRAIKNRFGNTNEVGIFEMLETGLKEVRDPSQYFLEDQLKDAYGRSLSCILEGSRPLFVEIQALVVENKYGTGRRTTQGLDTNRVAMLVAIIEKYFGIVLSCNDIYVNVVGGLKLTGRDTDLSIIASMLSSYRGNPLDPETIFLGEVGLTGEVRSVVHVETRLREMAQLNYKRVITSEKTAREYKNKYKIEIVGIKKASDISDYL